MSPLDVPVGLAMVGLSVGSIVGVFAFYGVCELIGRWRK